MGIREDEQILMLPKKSHNSGIALSGLSIAVDLNAVPCQFTAHHNAPGPSEGLIVKFARVQLLVS